MTSQAIEKFLALKDMEELRKYKLSVSEWNSLEVCQKILSVNAYFILMLIKADKYVRCHTHFSSAYLRRQHQLCVKHCQLLSQ